MPKTPTTASYPEDTLPWYGGICNRQLFADLARGFVTWLAVTIAIFVIVWFGADFFHLTSSTWRGVGAGLTGSLTYLVVRWLRA